MKILKAANTLKELIRKSNAGTLKESLVSSAISNGESDLYNELVQLSKTQGYTHEFLNPFIKSESATFSNGKYTGSGKVIQLLSIAAIQSGQKYSASIVVSNDQFTHQSFSDAMDANNGLMLNKALLEKKLATSTTSTVLPKYYQATKGGSVNVSGEYFDAVHVSPDRWGSHDVSDILTNKQDPTSLSHLNIGELTVTSTNAATGILQSPEGMIKVVSISSNINGKKYNGMVVTPDKFESRNVADMINDHEIKKQLTLINETIPIVNGVGNLPNNFILNRHIFEYDGNEGLIIDSEEYLDRKNSSILPPEEEYPIGRIYDDKIEVAPDSIKSIKLVMYKFPTNKQPITTLVGDKVMVEPAPQVGEEYTVRYIKSPVERRPIFKVDAGMLTVSPQVDFELTYVEYPTEKSPVALQIGASIELKPETVTSADIVYVEEMTPCNYAIKVKANQKGFEFDQANSIDTIFPDSAIQSIVAKAAKYIGIPYDDQEVINMERKQ